MTNCWRLIAGATLVLSFAMQGCTSSVESAETGTDTSSGSRFAVTSVYRPTYTTREGSRTVGTAFVIARQNSSYAVTAHHVFSEAGGFSRDFRWDEVADLVSSARFESLEGKGPVLTSKAFVPVDGAGAVSAATGRNDIAFFELAEGAVTHLRLAGTPPELGDAVWLHAPVQNRPSEQLFHRAEVTEYNRDWISYRFDDADLKIGGTSGAAIVNRRGEVVGVNLSGGVEDGELIASGNPLVSIRRVLKGFN